MLIYSYRTTADKVEVSLFSRNTYGRDLMNSKIKGISGGITDNLIDIHDT